jgi:hypothetical protein
MQRIKQQELSRSFTLNQRHPNLLDEDAKTSKARVVRLMSFPALTPTKSNPDQDRFDVPITFPPSPSPSFSKGKGKAPGQ